MLRALLSGTKKTQNPFSDADEVVSMDLFDSASFGAVLDYMYDRPLTLTVEEVQLVMTYRYLFAKFEFNFFLSISTNRMRALNHTSIYPQASILIHTYIHTYIHTHAHTCIIYTYILQTAEPLTKIARRLEMEQLAGAAVLEVSHDRAERQRGAAAVCCSTRSMSSTDTRAKTALGPLHVSMPPSSNNWRINTTVWYNE